MWECFPSPRPHPLPPVWEPHVCKEKKWFVGLNGLFCILGPFLGGSPMLKTVKNGSGIRVDPLPPPVFSKFPHFPVVFFANVPNVFM